MAWVQYLDALGTDKEILDDMDKDVTRLSTIADRFSKIGSKPEMELSFICDAVVKSLDYMKARISKNVDLTITTPSDDKGVNLCLSLFEWVMENLAKNAVDAMRGREALVLISVMKVKLYALMLLIQVKDCRARTLRLYSILALQQRVVVGAWV